MRKILHLDLDAFFCAVEELRRPDLTGKPFAVGGRPGERGVIASCSYPARQFGVHSAMPTAQAVQLCPELILIPGDHRSYENASQKVMAVLRNLTPLVEQISIDEAFMDISDLPESSEVIARRLQEQIWIELHLPCSLGAASNKLVAKIATDAGKKKNKGLGYPQAITVVPPGEEEKFLEDLPVSWLWGVGRKTEQRLKGLGIETIGNLAHYPVAEFEQMFGKSGIEMQRHARGVDDRPVTTEHEVKSISQEVTFDRDVSDPQRIRETLRRLASQVAFRLRQSEMCASTIRLKLRWADFSTITRQQSLEQLVDQDHVIYSTVQDLFEKAWQVGKKVRLVGVGASGLSSRPLQPGLWDTPSDKERRLLSAIDGLREKFGDQVVGFGRIFQSSASRKASSDDPRKQQ